MLREPTTTEGLQGWARAYPFQREAARALATGSRQGLWVATGLGKTATLLFAWALRGLPIPLLIVTKALGRSVWPRDARWALGRDLEPGVLVEGKTYGSGVHDYRGRRVYTSLEMALSERVAIVTNYEVLKTRSAELLEVPWAGVIFDEVHEIKGGHAPARKRNGVLHYLRYHYSKAIATKVRGDGGFVWTATATPIVDRRRDLFAQLDLVSPGLFGSAWVFLHRYCDARMNQWGGLDSTGVSNTEELVAKAKGLFVMLTKSEVASQLPTITWDVRLVPFDGSLMTFAGGSVETALDRAAEMKKDAVLDLVREYLTSGLKIVVVTGRRRTAGRLAFDITSESFGQKLPRHVRESYTCQTVTGEIEIQKRSGIIEDFNAKKNGPAALVATYDSIRDSVDIHQTDGIIIGQLPIKPGALEQLIGRFHRLKGRPSTLHVLIAERTIDEPYRERVIDKLIDVDNLGVSTQGADGVLGRLQSGGFDEASVLAGLIEDLKGME